MGRKKISLNHLTIARRFGDLRALEILKDAGFDAVDFGLEHLNVGYGIYSKSDEELVDYFEGVRRHADKIGIEIAQTHGRVSTYRPEPENAEYNRSVLESARKDLLATAALGVKGCVMHSVTTYWFPDATGEFMHTFNKQMLDSMIPYAEKYGTYIALETFGDAPANGERVIDYFGDVLELEKQYNMMDTKNKMLCMDTGHTHKAHDVKPSVMDTVEAIYYLGDRIKLLHLNDNNGYNDQHLPPLWAGSYTGLKWGEVMKALDDIGYEGVYNFELSYGYLGKMLDGNGIRFLGEYLRRFVDGDLAFDK